MKARPRRRIDVNLDELDQLIDRSMQAPLSASEGEKLKTAVHVMAERLLGKRNTEKTAAVLETHVWRVSTSRGRQSMMPWASYCLPASHQWHWR